ncbi:type II toxin-antitoxin system YafQ family toxin [uncultured Mailhella sp.]|uniref:type II toxin-antitoxin system YafQ family toxin n=1 Tax=uncultured Mailhella sp. TaxID=1981031 RepID=UPI00344E6992
MRSPTFTAQFRRDLRKVEHRSYDMQKLKTIIALLLNEEQLPERCRDHALKGEWRPYRELHIEPDWLLVYKVSGNDCVFYRVGTHADLFSL